MDLSNLSDKDLEALSSNDFASMSDAGLQIIAGEKSVKQESKSDAKQKIVDDAFKIPEYKGMSRGAGLVTRSMAPTLVGAEFGSYGGPMGAVAGATAIPASDAIVSLINALAGSNIPPTSQTIQNLMTSAGVPGAPETQTMPERVMSTGLETLTNVGKTVPALAVRGAELIPSVTGRVATGAAAEPATQAIAGPASTMAGQTVTEATGNPIAGLITQLATGGLGSAKTRAKTAEAPSSEYLGRVASTQYKALEDAGVKLDTKGFINSMDDIAKSLRDEGYTAKANPKVAAAIEEMTNQETPKDWAEIQALRKMARAGQKSIDPEERRIATILVDKFDDYMMNVPQKDVISGDMKNVGQLWADARSSYSKMKKAETFQDMLEEAQLDKSKFTQSGSENSLAKQLRDLAKNDKKMRLFSKEEQEAIKNAAKGGTLQNLLKLYGRFAPTGPVAGLFTGGLSFANPSIGVPVALGAFASRYGATKMRQASVEDLINQMRMGQQPEVVGGKLRAVAPTTVMGLLQSLEGQ